VLGDGVERAHLHLTEPLPVGRVRAERVGEVDEAVAGERGVHGEQLRAGPRAVASAVARGVRGGRIDLLKCIYCVGRQRQAQGEGGDRQRRQIGKACANPHRGHSCKPRETDPEHGMLGQLALWSLLLPDYFGSRCLCQLLFVSPLGSHRCGTAGPWRTMWPFFMTKSIRRRLSVSARGSTGMATRSAARPTARRPRSPSTRNSFAASLVIAFRSSAAGTPASRQTAR